MIDFKNLSKTPNETLCNSHYYCDYLELLALIDCDDGISIHDVYDRFLEDNKISEVGTENGGAENEEWMSRISNWFEEIKCRAYYYDSFYPFTYENNRIKKLNEINEEHYLYIYLLLASLLRHIEKYHSITTIFERISYLVLDKYLPKIAEIHVFGVSSDKNGKYQGSLEDKYEVLASDLGLTKSKKKHIFKAMDNGDGGVDIVAWIPFNGDPNLERKQIFLGQSACGKNWSNKQASVDRVKNYIIDLPSNAQNVLFVPYDFRDSSRLFCQDDEITASLVFDRHRILGLINYQDIVNKSWDKDIDDLIERVKLYQEDII